MKLISFTLLLLMLITGTDLSAQKKSSNTSEKYGTTLNLGIGLGYYSYARSAMPVLHANLELDVAKNFTLAPFISYYSYQNYNYWGGPNYPYKNYNYRETIIPIGVKASYYFDQLLHANSNWDFYLAGSLGFAIRSITWEDGYYGQKHVANGSSPLYIDIHIGTEYHVSNKVGLFLDLSSGVSTLGLGIHF